MWRVLVIAAAVVGLTCACSTTVGGTPKAERTPSPAPGATPAVANVDPWDLNGLLLTVDDIRSIMAAPELEIEDSYEVMPPSTVGYVPEDCARAAFNTVETGYRDSGFGAVRGMVFQEPEAMQLQHVVDQGVVSFPDAAAANTYVTRTLESWRRCAGTPFTALRPETAEHWTFGQVTENGGISAIPKIADGDTGWKCSHAIAAKVNVVIDVSACGFDVTDQATTVVARIRDKFPA